MRSVLTALFAFLISTLAFGAANTARVGKIKYATTNVTSTAYVTLISSTTISSTYLEVCDTSGKIVKIAKGAAGSEVDIGTMAYNGCVQLNQYVPAGTRISLEAAYDSATSGFGTFSLLP